MVNIDKFGKIMVEKVRDYVIANMETIIQGKNLTARQQKMFDDIKCWDEGQKQVLLSILTEAVDKTLFYVLEEVEESEDIQLLYKTEELKFVSDGLTGDLFNWIDKFGSKPNKY